MPRMQRGRLPEVDDIEVGKHQPDLEGFAPRVLGLGDHRLDLRHRNRGDEPIADRQGLHPRHEPLEASPLVNQRGDRVGVEHAPHAPRTVRRLRDGAVFGA